jgi:putative FmdB family regulatory protein
VKKDYECKQCGVFEVDRTLAEGELEFCPVCNSPVKRVYTSIPYKFNCEGACGKFGG